MEDDRTTFLWNVHSYTNEYIRFADAKAELVVGWTTAVIGALLAGGVQNKLDWSTPGGLRVAGLVLLTGGFVSAILAVTPRLRTTQLPGLIFWKSIRANKDSGKFIEAVNSQSKEQLNSHVAAHLFDLAKVADDKFWWCGIGIVLASLGSALSGVMFMIP